MCRTPRVVELVMHTEYELKQLQDDLRIPVTTTTATAYRRKSTAAELNGRRSAALSPRESLRGRVRRHKRYGTLSSLYSDLTR